MIATSVRTRPIDSRERVADNLPATPGEPVVERGLPTPLRLVGHFALALVTVLVLGTDTEC